VTSQQLTKFALEMAKSILFLEKKQFVHRDIAARNFLLTEYLKIKLSDFGMAKAQNEYSIKGDTQIPVRWCAPEVLTRNKFTVQTDRYSLGVTFWELFSKGAKPLTAMSNQEIVDAALSEDYPKLRLSKLKNCPDKIMEIIYSLTSPTPTDRPSLEIVVDQLVELAKDVESPAPTRQKRIDEDDLNKSSEGDNYTRSPPILDQS